MVYEQNSSRFSVKKVENNVSYEREVSRVDRDKETEADNLVRQVLPSTCLYPLCIATTEEMHRHI